jgi:hypothetical protein
MNDFVNLLEHSDLTRSVWPGNPDPFIVLFIIILAFAVGMFIGFVYMWTHDALSYSRTFVSALAVMPLIVAMLMLAMAGNIFVAFGLLGVFRRRALPQRAQRYARYHLYPLGGHGRHRHRHHSVFHGRLGRLGHRRRLSLPPVCLFWHAAAL